MSGRLVRGLLLVVIFGAGIFLHAWLTFTDTSTEDEHVHLYAGAVLLDRGATSINLEHPPLAKLAAAAALLPLRTNPPRPVELDQAQNLGLEVARFAYGNQSILRRILNASRIPFLMATLALALVVFFAARWWTDFAGALIAASLTLFSPLLLAVGHLVHTDLPVTLLVTSAWLIGIRWIENGRLGMAMLTGGLFGLALLSKFSAALFVAAFAIVALSLGRARIQLLLVLVIAAAVVAGGMAVAYRNVDAAFADRLAAATGRSNFLLETPLLRPLGIYFFGLQTFLIRGELTVNYLAGDFSPTGWWYYFPVAFVLKTPLAVLLLGLIAAGTRARSFDRTDVLLLLPAVLYFGVSLFSNYNIGVRHLLPIYPFLHLFVGRAVASRPQLVLRRSAAFLVLFAVGESLFAYPHVMGFFNLLGGGRETATFVLSDSNVDWGQDNGRLKRYLTKTNRLPARVLLMGGSLPEVEIGPGIHRIDPNGPAPAGTYAVSRTLLMELTSFAALPADHPLRARLAGNPRFTEPYGSFLAQVRRGKRVASLGNSIDIYEVRR